MQPHYNLEEFHLEPTEADVYIALLKRGGAQASILARDTGIKRTSMYTTLANLTRKGFVKTVYKKSLQWYTPVPPYKVADSFRKKADAFELLIPKLEALSSKSQDVFGIQVIESLQELKDFYLGVPKEYKGMTYDSIGNTNTWNLYDRQFFESYREMRARAGIATRVLLTRDSKSVNPKNNKELLRDVRYLPEVVKFKSVMDIFPDKVLLISPELHSLALVIETRAMIDIFQGMFSCIWELV